MELQQRSLFEITGERLAESSHQVCQSFLWLNLGRDAKILSNLDTLSLAEFESIFQYWPDFNKILKNLIERRVTTKKTFIMLKSLEISMARFSSLDKLAGFSIIASLNLGCWPD